MTTILGILLILTSTFLILLVLVQRGRGGGLTGALGGLGGQSAFGAKAGDVFTRITVVAATVWILLCVVSVKLMGGGSGDVLSEDLGGAAVPPPGGAIHAPFDADKPQGAPGTTPTGQSPGAPSESEGGGTSAPNEPAGKTE